MSLLAPPAVRIRIVSSPGERFRVRLLQDHINTVNLRVQAQDRDVVKFVKLVPGYAGARILIYEDATGERFAGILSYQSVSARVPLKKQPFTKKAGASR